MFPILRQHWTLWAAWTVAASVALFAEPWIAFSWAELAACLGSLALSIDRRTRRETLLAVGLPAIALLVLAESESVSVIRLVVDWFVFIVAVLLGARAVDDQRELEHVAGHLALGADSEHAEERLRRRLAEEIARSRRYGRTFILLAVAPHPRAFTKEPASNSHVMRKIAAARWVLEIADALSRELHRYAHVDVSEDRALCVVPEIEGEEAIDALTSRLAAAVDREYQIEIEVGVARFPDDALAAEDLISVAREDRRSLRLASLPSPGDDTDEDVRQGESLRDARA